MVFILNNVAFLVIIILFLYGVFSIFSIAIKLPARIRTKITQTRQQSNRVYQNCNSCTDGEELRKMGSYENVLMELHSMFNCMVYSVLSLQCVDVLRRQNVLNTLELLATKHPILRSHVSNKRFIINHHEKFSPNLRFVNTTNWKIVLEEEFSSQMQLSNGDHLWKTIVLREHYDIRRKMYINTFLFLFHPTIADRSAALYFAEDFTTILCTVVNCDSRVDCSRTLHLPSSPESYLTLSFSKIIKLMIEHLMGKICSFVSGSSQKRYLHKKPIPKFHCKPLILFKSLTEQDTHRILDFCSRQKCSLTALFITAWLDIMSYRAGSRKALAHKKPLLVVANYRALLPTKMQQAYLCNCSVSFQVNDLKSKAKYFISKMVENEHLLQSALQNNAHCNLLWKLKYGILKKEALCKLFPFEFCDVGRFSFKQTAPFSLLDIFIGTNSSSTVNLTLGIINGRLHCIMHLTSHFSGCSDLLNIIFARIVQNIASEFH